MLILYRSIHDQRDFVHLQLDIDQVSDWVDENHLTLNAAKSKVIVISRWREHSTPEVCLSLLSQPLEQVENYKYLEVLLNSSLNWSTHIHNICSRARRIVRLLFRTFTAHSNTSSLLQLYISLMCPHFEYACAGFIEVCSMEFVLSSTLVHMKIYYPYGKSTSIKSRENTS